ncbi:MAG: hypothetical protein HYS59_02190 [Candidatus Vogelbacteria bacterium]|nr:hypothetical protein [Candidatus Vogelbacteria bacterium]
MDGKIRQTELFTRTRMNAPKDEISRNAELLVRAGYVDKLMAGVYSYLPLGLRVIKNIEQIIREELQEVGAQEVFLPSLQPKEHWTQTGRWETMNDLYKVVDASGREFALGPTHEEIIVPLVQKFALSYRDFPFSVYQFQNKFRMELRAKSGLLRGREFLMKDMYSFHVDVGEFASFYERMQSAYSAIFNRVGIGERTFLTYASGGSFSRYSHEYQTITAAGEDTIHLCRKCGIAINDEIIADKSSCPKCGSVKLSKEKSIEVGNIFELKTRFTEAFGFSVMSAEGVRVPIFMGCYGIGLGRLMGTIAEALSDSAGLVWPKSVAPYKFHLIELSAGRGAKLFESLPGVLYDDRDVGAGEKFADADLLGLPYRVIASEKTESAGAYEMKDRATGEVRHLSEVELLKV